MTIGLESDMTDLTTELMDLKNACQDTALNLPAFKSTATASNRGKHTVITFASDNGYNALAMLEMTVTPDSALSGLKVQQVPYSGGARWELFNSQSASYAITVRAPMHGKVTVS